MKSLTSFLVSIVALGLVHLGFIENHEWASNLFKFYSWLVFVPLALVFWDEEFRQKTRAKGLSLPLSYSITVRTLLCGVMAATGHFWYAFMWAFIGVVFWYVHKGEELDVEAA